MKSGELLQTAIVGRRGDLAASSGTVVYRIAGREKKKCGWTRAAFNRTSCPARDMHVEAGKSQVGGD